MLPPSENQFESADAAFAAPSATPRAELARAVTERAAVAVELAAGYSPAFRKVEISSIVLFAVMFLRTVYRMNQAAHFSPAAVTVGGLAGWVLADFLSGLVHWGADTWGSAKFPVLGPTLIRSFREHHVDPMAITRHDFIETNGASCLVCLPILLFSNFFSFAHAPAWVLGGAAALLSLSFWTFMTNQAHQWAHRGRGVAKSVAWLQKIWIVLPSARHAEHHRMPFMHSYCITTGWMNPLLNRVNFFRRLEAAVTRMTGARPREEDEILTGRAH